MIIVAYGKEINIPEEKAKEFHLFAHFVHVSQLHSEQLICCVAFHNQFLSFSVQPIVQGHPYPIF